MNSKVSKSMDILPIILFIISVINLLLCSFTGIISLIISIVIFVWTIIKFKKKDILYNISLGTAVCSIIIFACINIFGIFDVNKKMDFFKQNKFVDVAIAAVDIAKEDYVLNDYKNTKCYMIKDINKINKKSFQLNYSPVNVKYSDTSFIKIYYDENNVINSSICLIDSNKNGFSYIDYSNINRKNLSLGNADICVLPSDCQ